MRPSTTPADVRPDLQAGFDLAGWAVHPRLNRMERRGETVQVEPKMMQVLVLLAGHAGEPVTREELLDTVWADTVVSDDVLTRSISELRKLFGDDPRYARVIETIPRVGYRLIAPVVVDAAGDSVPRAPSPADVALRAPGRHPRIPGWPIGVVLLLGAWLAGWLLVRPEPPAPLEPLAARPITSLAGRELMAALSPEGDRIAFVWSGDEAQGGMMDVYVMRTDGTGPLRLTDHPDREVFPAWSPDGERIAFSRSSEEACAIYVVPALGGPEEKVAGCRPGDMAQLSWSPDGASLAVADGTSEQNRFAIDRIDLATGERHRLVPPGPAATYDFAPRYSPDGTLLAFGRSEGEGLHDLYVMALPDGTPRRLTTGSRIVSGLAWTPDGRHLIFGSNRAGSHSLWRVPVAGGAPAWLALGDVAYRPGMDRRQHRLVYERWEMDSNIYAVPRGTTAAEPVPIATSTRMDFYPHVSPDGKRLVFVSDRTGTYEVWTSDLDGANARQLTAQGAPYAWLPRWSPDGQRIAYTSYHDGQSDVFVIDAPGEAPRRLTTDAAEDMAPSWSPDGRWIYFGSDRSGRWQVWRIPAGGGPAEPVTTEGGYVAHVSADGAWLYYTRRSDDGLWRRPVDGGPEAKILDALDRSDAYNWALHASGLFFIDRTPAPGIGISFFDVAQGRVTETLPLGRVMTEGGFAVTPDGQTLLFIRIDQANADLMLVEDVR